MFCKYCGSQIDEDSIFCQKCGESQTSNNENIKTGQRTVKTEKSNFPNIKNQSVETGWNIKAILFALLSVAGLPMTFALARDDMTGGGFDDYIMVFVAIVILVISFLNIKKTYYRIMCPRCNKSTSFPGNSQSHDCDCCKSKLILQENGDITPFQ